MQAMLGAVKMKVRDSRRRSTKTFWKSGVLNNLCAIDPIFLRTNCQLKVLIVVVCCCYLLFVLLHVKRNSRFNFVTWVSYVMCHAWHHEFWRYSQRDLDLKPWIVWRDPSNLKQPSKLDPSQIAWWRISFQSKIYDDSRHVGFPKFHRWFSHLTFSHLQHRRLEDDFPLESTYFFWSYCWWTKYRVLTIPNGAGFLPSTVC